jgi:hypothetical protein
MSEIACLPLIMIPSLHFWAVKHETPLKDWKILLEYPMLCFTYLSTHSTAFLSHLLCAGHMVSTIRSFHTGERQTRNKIQAAGSPTELVILPVSPHTLLKLTQL